jgi:hypothetical protein
MARLGTINAVVFRREIAQGTTVEFQAFKEGRIFF